MEANLFQAGPQTAGSEVIDSFGVHWTLLKNIGYATAQPREGQYYTRVVSPPEPAEEVITVELDIRDFWFEEVTVDGTSKLTLRIRR